LDGEESLRFFATLRMTGSEGFRMTPHSVIARLTKPAEAISGMGKRLPRSTRNDIRGRPQNEKRVHQSVKPKYARI
jgi:hypothetical protein